MCRQNQPQQPQQAQAQPTQQGQPQQTQQAQTAEPIDKELYRANTELQIAQTQANAEFNKSTAGQLQRQFEAYQRIAKPLSESDFVPSNYKGNLANCTIAVEMAARMGVFPLTVMQNLFVVKGKPTWASKFLIGCVNTCGRYTTLDYHIGIDGSVGDVTYKTWTKIEGRNTEIQKPFENPMLDNLTCVAFATEKATGKLLQSPAVSIRMAIQEGWYTKDGSKWPTMPELMLRYRAASYWVSTFAPEMAMGFRTTEEERDIEDVEYEDVTETSNQRPLPKRSTNMEEAKEKLRERDQKKANQTSKTEMP